MFDVHVIKKKIHIFAKHTNITPFYSDPNLFFTVGIHVYLLLSIHYRTVQLGSPLFVPVVDSTQRQTLCTIAVMYLFKRYVPHIVYIGLC